MLALPAGTKWIPDDLTAHVLMLFKTEERGTYEQVRIIAVGDGRKIESRMIPETEAFSLQCSAPWKFVASGPASAEMLSKQLDELGYAKNRQVMSTLV